jgi:hypothetical protein
MAAKKKKSSPNTIVHDAPAVWAGEAKYRAEDDHRTLTRAGEIKADRDRMKAAQAHHKSMNKNMEKVCK